MPSSLSHITVIMQVWMFHSASVLHAGRSPSPSKTSLHKRRCTAARRAATLLRSGLNTSLILPWFLPLIFATWDPWFCHVGPWSKPVMLELLKASGLHRGALIPKQSLPWADLVQQWLFVCSEFVRFVQCLLKTCSRFTQLSTGTFPRKTSGRYVNFV